MTSLSRSTRGSLRDPGARIGALLVTVAFVLICLWFGANDVHNACFGKAGSIYITYQCLKLVSACYVTWVLYFTGHCVLELLRRNGVDFQLEVLDRIIVALYVGASVLEITMFGLGWIHAYYTTVAIAIVTPIVFLSCPHLFETIGNTKNLLLNSKLRSLWSVRWLLFLIALVLLLLILVNKALLPTSDGDSLTHYINYYNEVIRTHGISPNNVWYHFYYSKGAGLIYLNMLLADDTTASFPTFYMLVGTVAVLFSLTRKLTASSEWAWAAVITYLCTIPLDGQIAFEKQHLFMTSLIAAVLFMVILLPRIAAEARRSWTFLTSLVVIHLAIFTPTAIAFLAPPLCVCAVFLFFAGRKASSRSYFVVAMAGISMAAVMCGINYWLTGMASIEPCRLMWSWADQRRFSLWTSPYMMVYVDEGSNRTIGTFTLTKAGSLSGWFFHLFHFDSFRMLFPNLFVVGVVGVLIGVSLRTQPQLRRAPVIDAARGGCVMGRAGKSRLQPARLDVSLFHLHNASACLSRDRRVVRRIAYVAPGRKIQSRRQRRCGVDRRCNALERAWRTDMDGRRPLRARPA